MSNDLTPDEIDALGTGFEPANFDEIWRAIGRLPFASGGQPFAWRGVSKATYSIQPNLHRWMKSKGYTSINEEKMRGVEQDILSQAREWGLGRVNNHEVSDLQLLCYLQHAGCPTRLLDITSNPLTAMWFACFNNPEDDALLIAFDRSGLTTIRAERSAGSRTYGEIAAPHSANLASQLIESENSRLPFIVRPTFLDPRMAAQEGFFIASACPDEAEGQEQEYREIPRPRVEGLYLTDSGYIPRGAAEHMLFDDNPEFGYYNVAVWSLKIRASLKEPILRALENNFDKTASTLFPDFAGFREMARVWNATQSAQPSDAQPVAMPPE